METQYFQNSFVYLKFKIRILLSVHQVHQAQRVPQAATGRSLYICIVAASAKMGSKCLIEDFN